MLKADKIKKGLYSLKEKGKVVGEVSENSVGRYGEASYRWRGTYKGRSIHGGTMTEAIRTVFPKWTRHTVPESIEDLRRERDKYKELYESLSKRVSKIHRVASGLIGTKECTGLTRPTTPMHVIGEQLRKYCFGYEADGKTKL